MSHFTNLSNRFASIQRLVIGTNSRTLSNIFSSPLFSSCRPTMKNSECLNFPLFMAHNYFRCVMALIRGLGGLCPCPICLIPRTKQMDLAGNYTLRLAKDSKTLVEQTEKMRVVDRNDILKAKGL